ncbi:uncharacterized protein KY384_008507 [Bacidia gigantensis]|uniref:uncharacterized protein n=1 Tax=Bacidia gigantensis TaxID=2732470 RepID=UPI001D04848B|nr:uncharacterized protein KY384_008507 [Bacidia gigantensis]KAG8527078.1 hypothetical protein KY384_008507 [Bacidia gigantensis]
MNKVYKFAALNIAATGFPDGRAGLFVDRDLESILPLELYIPWLDLWPMSLSKRKGYYFLAEHQLWYNNVERAPLNKRAWVLQERLLSPCTLHFGHSQLFWECAEFTRPEVHPKRDHFSNELHWVEKLPLLRSIQSTSSEDIESATFEISSIDNSHATLSMTDTGRDKSQLYNLWGRIMCSYSTKTLTNPEDVFPALSGLAQEFKHFLKDRYLAGLLEGNLLQTLLWFRRGSEAPLVSSYRAPSWSWASFTGSIASSYGWKHKLERKARSQILEASTTPVADETGQLVDGYIRIKDALTRAAYSETENAWKAKDKLTHLIMDTKGFIGGEDLRRERESEHAPFRYNFTLIEHEHKDTELFLLPLFSNACQYPREGLTGLVLTPCDIVRGHYYRCGILTCESSQVHERLNAGFVLLDEQYYEEYHGEGEYVISII